LPFIRYTYNDVTTDIYINNLSPHYATKLISRYYKFDSRFLSVNDFILQWAKARNLINEFDGYLSSYAITLLVIFFLKILKEPVLASIQQYAMQINLPPKMIDIPSFHGLLRKKLEEGEERKYKAVLTTYTDISFKDVDIEDMKEKLGYPKNSMSVGELITLFFYYFGFDYNVSLYAKW